MRRAFTQALGSELADIAGVQSPYGLVSLRREVSRHLVARGIACDPAAVAIVNGAQQAIDLATRVLLDPGDSVVLEQPGYFGARVAFTALSGERHRASTSTPRGSSPTTSRACCAPGA